MLNSLPTRLPVTDPTGPTACNLCHVSPPVVSHAMTSQTDGLDRQTSQTDLYTQLCDKLSTFSEPLRMVSLLFFPLFRFSHLFFSLFIFCFFFLLLVTLPNMPVGPFGTNIFEFFAEGMMTLS